jgi:hypothetical protein
MKKLAPFSFIAALAALLSLASPATAGLLVVNSGPTFTPESAFTNNTIIVDTTMLAGALVHIDGGATITPDESNQVSVAIGGTFTANQGDLFSGAYSFTADLNIDTPVTYTITGLATVQGAPLEFKATGTLMPGLHKYQDVFQAPISFPIADSGDFSATLVLDFGSVGGISTTPGTLDLTIDQVDVQLDPDPVAVQEPSLSQNISTRANVGTGDNVLIGGFIITGTDPKTVVLRAIGPSLDVNNVSDSLADPFLELHDSTGALLVTNDNWMDLSADDQTTLNDNMLAPNDPAESALVMTLDPGVYTAIVRGVNDTTGVALVEVYDIDGGTTDSKLANISTRGFVETGENVMIGGIILGGGGGGFSTVIVRGLGPSLSNANVSEVLANPFLELHNGDGDLIDSNDNWMDDPNMQMVSDAGLAPTDPNEAALYEILPAAPYTAILSGVGDTTGIGLVEFYNTD